MQHWDLRTLPVTPHEPLILDSRRGEARTVVINLPAGEALQESDPSQRSLRPVSSVSP